MKPARPNPARRPGVVPDGVVDPNGPGARGGWASVWAQTEAHPMQWVRFDGLDATARRKLASAASARYQQTGQRWRTATRGETIWVMRCPHDDANLGDAVR